jgi:hypothetical protein
MPTGEQPPTDVSGHSQQVFGRDQLDALVATGLGQLFEVNLAVDRDDADQIARLVTARDERFIDLPGRQADFCSDRDTDRSYSSTGYVFSS